MVFEWFFYHAYISRLSYKIRNHWGHYSTIARMARKKIHSKPMSKNTSRRRRRQDAFRKDEGPTYFSGLVHDKVKASKAKSSKPKSSKPRAAPKCRTCGNKIKDSGHKRGKPCPFSSKGDWQYIISTITTFYHIISGNDIFYIGFSSFLLTLDVTKLLLYVSGLLV